MISGGESLNALYVPIAPEEKKTKLKWLIMILSCLIALEVWIVFHVFQITNIIAGQQVQITRLRDIITGLHSKLNHPLDLISAVPETSSVEHGALVPPPPLQRCVTLEQLQQAMKTKADETQLLAASLELHEALDQMERSTAQKADVKQLQQAIELKADASQLLNLDLELRHGIDRLERSNDRKIDANQLQQAVKAKADDSKLMAMTAELADAIKKIAHSDSQKIESNQLQNFNRSYADQLRALQAELRDAIGKIERGDGQKVDDQLEAMTTTIKYNRGGDWTEVWCDHGHKVVSGGCNAVSGPLLFQYHGPVGDSGWKCGGHGGDKEVWAICRAQ
mmetsp:Transcript_107831/g.207301  ORF Transcript_107831/g.207301 Transcript_107831/m.207301 type:complete len:336 (+) Transcript_107831:60-1067(+)